MVISRSSPAEGSPAASHGSKPTGRASPSPVRRLLQAFEGSVVGHSAQLLKEIAIMDKAILLASVSFISFIPLLIVLAAVVPLDQVHDFAGTLQLILGLDRPAAVVMHRLFAPAAQVAGATTAVGLAVVVVSALAFVSTLEQSYELIWNLRPASWIQTWASRCVWLGAFLGYGLVLALLQVALNGGAGYRALAALAAFVVTAGFFTWSLHLLLDGRIGWLELVPGGVATAIGLAGLRGFSTLFFSSMIVSNQRQYGAIGPVFILISWLIGASVVLVGGAAVGAMVSRRIFRASCERLPVPGKAPRRRPAR